MRRELLPGSLAVAVARLQDGEWQSVSDEPLAPPVDEPASVVVEENSFDKWGLVVRGNGGCRFHEQEDMLIAVMEEEELREPAEARGWDLAPNVMWLLEQAFAVHPSVSVSVAIDRVHISLYEETVDGDSTAYGPVDQETAERVAEDLREVLGRPVRVSVSAGARGAARSNPRCLDATEGGRWACTSSTVVRSASTSPSALAAI